GLHEGTVAAITANNPYAAFTTLRAYAENAAAILYLKDNPTKLDTFWRTPHSVPIGKITNYAPKRFAAFQQLYEPLSQYAHPASRSLLASMHVGEGRRMLWSSAPRFKSDSDAVLACAWTVAIAE